LIDAGQLADWIPARVSWHEEEPLIDWCYLGEQLISEVNFDQTLNKCIELPFNLLFRHRTSMEALRKVAEARPGIRPTGFIFHSTRSGSTLLMRTLAALPTNIVLSEARPIDSLLRAKRFKSSVTDAERVEWVRLMVSNLAQPSRRGARHLFIKFHCWNIFDLRIIRLAFPDVPWIFVYRDPIEELVSQMKQRDAHMIPGVIDPQLFEMDQATISEMAPEDYCAKVLQAHCEAALQSLPDGGLVINSSQLPEAFSTISGFFGLSWSANEMEVMTNRTNLTTTQSDSTSKTKRATERLCEAARTWVYPAYNALEQARLAQPFQSCVLVTS
jgi:hypothetical protein